MDDKPIGFVGVGRMGGPMARRLLDAGQKLCAFDISEDALGPLVNRGVKRAASPAEVASSTSTVFLSLPTPDIIRAVAFGEKGLSTGTQAKIVVDMSTTGPRVTGEAAAKMAEKGVAWIDSPVSGGIAGAEKGTLAVMASGQRKAFDAVEPLLKNFGKVFYVGEKPGLAQTAKLANNLLSAAAMAVSSEAMVMGMKAGLDPKILLDIINAGSGRNTATQDKFPRVVLPGTFDFGFATGLSYKDVRMCVDEAEALGVPMVVGAAVRQMLAVTNAKYGPDSDFTEICRVVEEWAGVKVRSK